jgi:hypothetical protein
MPFSPKYVLALRFVVDGKSLRFFHLLRQPFTIIVP